MIKSLSCMMMGACLMFSMTACSLGQSIEVLDQDKIVLLQTEDMVSGEDIAVVETSEGVFKMRFFPSEAPKTVENFIELAESGYFDGQMISRIEKIDQEDRTKGRIVAGSGKPVAEEGKCILKKSWNRKFPIIWQPFRERSCPMLRMEWWTAGFYCGFPQGISGRIG